MAKLYEGIEGYSEMTAEQKLAALEALEKVDTDKEIERYKTAASKANSEAADYKRKLSEKMSEQERAQAEREEELKQLREAVAESKRKEAIAEHKAQYAALGYSEELAEKAATAMAEGNSADMFTALKDFLSAHDKSYRDQLLRSGSEPPAGASNEPSKKYTADDLRKMSPEEINKNWDSIKKSL